MIRGSEPEPCDVRPTSWHLGRRGWEIKFNHIANNLINHVHNEPPMKSLDTKAQWSFLDGDHEHVLREFCVLRTQKL